MSLGNVAALELWIEVIGAGDRGRCQRARRGHCDRRWRGRRSQRARRGGDDGGRGGKGGQRRAPAEKRSAHRHVDCPPKRACPHADIWYTVGSH